MASAEQRLESPIHRERQMRVICIGAGASGLCFAYKLQRSFNNFTLAVYEKNRECSGTWFENKYPGAGQNVGLIGNGSSGIQVLPAIQSIVKDLTTFIREPTWISPPFGMDQHVYTKEELKEFVESPDVLMDIRKANESGLNSMFALYMKESQTQKDMVANMKSSMQEKLKDNFLEEKLIPQWGVGCRRLTPGINYLETLHKPNVKVVYGEIEKITEKGCLCDDGKEYPVDILICATGFDTSFRPRFPTIGPNNVNLQDAWAKEPKSYLGLAASGFPNYFIFLGPNCPIGNGPVLSAIECQADYMLTLVDRWQTENIKTMEPKMEAVEDFVAHTDQFMKRTIWQEDCRSWYKNNSASARVSALWPGSTLHYIETMKETRFDDWNITYEGNRFSYLGNGYSQTELDPTCDLGYYIRTKDDSPYSSKDMRRKVLTKSSTKKTPEKNPVQWAPENMKEEGRPISRL